MNELHDERDLWPTIHVVVHEVIARMKSAQQEYNAACQSLETLFGTLVQSGLSEEVLTSPLRALMLFEGRILQQGAGAATILQDVHAHHLWSGDDEPEEEEM